MTGLHALRRWGETGVAAGLAALGLWLGVRAGLSGAWLGWGLAGLGVVAALWARAAAARARLGGGPAGAGVVEIDEGRIAVFGPLHGGVATLEEITGVDVLPGPAWRLRTLDGALVIPAGAANADRLPEALSALPGFSAERAVAAFVAAPAAPREVWRRAPRRAPRPPAPPAGGPRLIR